MRVVLIILLCFAMQALSAQSYGGISGKIQDEYGHPLPEAVVTVLDGDRTITSSTTYDDGTYRVRPLKPGNYTVRISERYHEIKNFNKIPVPANKFVILDVTLTPPGKPTRQEIRLVGGRQIYTYSYEADTSHR